jgi:CRISPR/Cas system CSM-associated protein Csm3 (group 7 of RAMP superfamily)
MSSNPNVGYNPVAANMEDSFVIPGTSLWGKFRCAVCSSLHLRWNFQDGILILSCEDCGNFAQTNFILGNEVDNGGT